MGPETWIKADDTLALWTFLVGWAAVSIGLEQKYRWASTLTGCMIALIGAMLLANFGVVPLDAPAYDVVWGYVVPLAIPLLLFDADIRRIRRESGRTFISFHFAALGTVLGTFIATFLLHEHIPEMRGVSAMLCGSYIGGSLNLAAMKDAFAVSPDMTGAAVVADNFLMAFCFFVLMSLPSIGFFRKHYRMSREAIRASAESASEGLENHVAHFWRRREVSLMDLAGSVAVTFVIVTVSEKLAGYIGASALPGFLRALLGQKYLLITTLTVLGATFFPGFFSALGGARELGTFFIHIFFVVIGVPASFTMILSRSPLLFAYAAIIVFVNMAVTLGLGKGFGFDLEELAISCNATIGGPTTAAAMAIAKGWDDLVAPALLVGIWGYVIGNYAAIVTANCLGNLLS
ncbi:MAG: DUF819 family protein [Synergistaceae bacterium]|jgi:uncharacterized membrane protein|nr:DUF819 family protein [Synergistaceae bacterium]